MRHAHGLTQPITWRMSAWGIWARSVGLALVATFAAGQVMIGMELGGAEDIFTRFVMFLFLYGLVQCLMSAVALMKHRSRIRRIPSDFNEREMGEVLEEQADDQCPFVGVLSGLYEQHCRNPKAVDEGPLIEALEARLYRFGPQGIFRTVKLMLALGFLGTCFGMLMTMNEMSAAAGLAGRDGAVLTEMLLGQGGPLANLGGAYMSTLVALACGSVVLQGLGYVQEDATEAIVMEFREIVARYIKPSLLRGHDA